MWMIIAGVLAGVVAKLLMPTHDARGIFFLSISGSIIAGVLEYSEGVSIGFVGPLIGAVALLILYAFTARQPVEAKKVDYEDFRRAA
jgi:uncharacterized membrane protein YeaQ/YmgE (transglycosylase-associated protein family)